MCSANGLLIASRRTLISAGTERMLVEFGQSNLIQKAMAQPDRVRQVLDKMGTDGILPTLEAVFTKLDEPLPLGYCNAGVVLEVGSSVTGFKPGDRVVSNGPHAEVVSVPKNLCARIPDDVDDDSAAFTVLSAIALQGIRLANPTLGEQVVVSGLGLIGLVTVQLLLANGCRVLGLDFDARRLALAKEFGAEVADLGAGVDPIAAGMAFSGGRGVDAVIITASTSSNEVVAQAAKMSRKRGRIILVGVVGLNLSRADFYEKELTFQVSCSYGPGRYDESYEQQGRDYPFGFVRWTEQRNFEAILQLLEAGKLNVAPLISEHIPQAEAPRAYQQLVDAPQTLGILLTYPEQSMTVPAAAPFVARPGSATNKAQVGFIGAGNFGVRVLLPALAKAGAVPAVIASSTGTTAAVAAGKFKIPNVVSDYHEVLNSTAVNTVFIATRHNNHARLVVEALKAGKHVFVEKPLALNRDEVAQIEGVLPETAGQQLMVGFNRRFAPLSVKAKKLLDGRSEPCAIIYTVNAGFIPAKHWTQDLQVGGGRIIGEACHFIDLIRYLVGHPITGLEARMVGEAPGVIIQQDKMSIFLNFADGSTGVVHYLANGSKSFPKERVEIFVQERVLVLDNFKNLKGYGWPNFKGIRQMGQDKGHAAEVQAFISRVQTGGEWLIPWAELREVTLATFAAVERAAEPLRSIEQ